MSARISESDLSKFRIAEPETRFSKPRITKQEISDRIALEEIQRKTRAAATIEPEEAIRVNLRPLSVNAAWQGKRFKTPAYSSYSASVIALLPKFKMPNAPYRIDYEFGFSNKASDIDNPVKLILDILCQKYGFNDRDIYEMSVKKVIVPKGEEYFSFLISAL